jgi:hypothetical protein
MMTDCKFTSTDPSGKVILRKNSCANLDLVEKSWTPEDGIMFPLSLPGQFDPNAAHKITRVSATELVIVNTAGNTLRWIGV